MTQSAENDALAEVRQIANEMTEWWLLPTSDPEGGKEAFTNLLGRLRSACDIPPEVKEP
jgi:hypothetical protein